MIDKNEKDREKFEKVLKSSEEELQTLAEELNELEEDTKNATRNAAQVRKKAEDTEHVCLSRECLIVGIVCQSR